MKGLCPFHDEKSPSFHVTPAREFCHCFGCGEGGDVINFLMKIDGLSFVETVERLADKYGVQLRREEGDVREDRPKGPAAAAADRGAPGGAGVLRRAAADARRGRRPGSSSPSAASTRRRRSTFGLGFAPREGEALFKHLRAQGVQPARSSVAAGLVAVGRSAYDRFRGRLLWPIRDASGETIGFGARRIFDDDRIEAKYLNTSETPIYKKSQVLYGIDLARREIARSSQAVIVEGYTDVMACHLAGVGTAVATCGTAFGDEHSRVLRRFLDDHEEFRGEVIFTFDGDAAGQKAALRGVRRRPELRLPDLRRGRARRARPVRPADQEGRRRGARAGGPAGAAVPVRARQRGRQVRPRPRRRPGRRAARGGAAGLEHPRPVEGRRVRPRDRRDDRRSTSRRPAPRCAGPRPSAGARRPALRLGLRPRLRRRRRSARRGPRAARSPTCATRASRSSGRPSSWCSSTRWRSAGPPASRRRRLHAPDLPRACGRLVAAAGGPGAGAGDPGWAAGLRGARHRPGGVLGDQRARGRAAADRQGADASYVAAARLPPARAHRDAPDRRGQVAAAAHQPGRARRRSTTGCSASWPRSSSTAASCATGGGRPVRRRGSRSQPAAGRGRPRGSGCWPGRDGRRRAPSPAPATRSTCRRRRRIPWEQVEAADWDRELRGAAGQRGRHLGRAAARRTR